LDAAELEQLRLALSSSGTFEAQQQLCPKRRGGPQDGELPKSGTLSEISQAMRQVTTLRALQRQDLIAAATKDRCGQLGLDPQLTNAVVRVVAEEALRQQATNQVGSFAINAANVLLMAEGMRTKGKVEEVKIGLRKEKLKLEREKFQVDTCEFFLKWFNDKRAQEIAGSKSSNADKIAQLRREYFKDVDELEKSGKVVLPE
jgi:hypothetical protein